MTLKNNDLSLFLPQRLSLNGVGNLIVFLLKRDSAEKIAVHFYQLETALYEVAGAWLAMNGRTRRERTAP